MGAFANGFKSFFSMFSRLSPSPVQRIGVLSGLEAIGDALLKIPFLRALRSAYPEAEIHWITTKGPTAYNGPLHETVRPLLNEIHETPDWILEKSKTAPSFDLVIDTRGRWKLALQARHRLPHKVFIAPAFRYLFSDKRPFLLKKRPEKLIDRLLQTVELAAGTIPEVTGHLPIPPNMLAKARRILPEGELFIGFAPGAGDEIKKWPLENFEKLAQLQARQGRIPVFLLGPQEMDLYDRLFCSVPEAIFPLQAHEVWKTQTPSVDQTLAIGRCLTLAVTNDSGTSHMLAAVDCPLISLFGPTSAAKLAPSVTYGRVLCAQDFGAEDMAAIPVESVQKSIEKVILLLSTV